jgi:hypothetical protein
MDNSNSETKLPDVTVSVRGGSYKAVTREDALIKLRTISPQLAASEYFDTGTVTMWLPENTAEI